MNASRAQLQPAGWDAHGYATPPAGAAYTQIMRGASFTWWRSVLGALTAAMLYSVLAGLVLLIVLYLAWSLAHQGMPREQYFADAQAFRYPAGMVGAHLAIASLIPLSLLMYRLVHRIRGGWLISVRPGVRWGYLAVCLGIAAVVFTTYVATMPLRGQPLVFRPQADFVVFLVVIVLTSPLQAAGEEFFFRGYLLQALGSVVRTPWFGVVCSSLVFALYHGVQNLPLFLSRLCFGLLAGWLVVSTGGLEAGIAAHVINNLFAFSLAALTASVAQARAISHIGWAMAFGDVITFAVFAAGAWLAARWMKVGDTVAEPPAVAPR